MDKEVYKGVWFLPDKLNEEVVGSLTISEDDRFYLDLYGRFSGPQNLNKKVEIILGYSSTGEKFTLIDNYIHQFTLPIPGFSTCTFSPNRIIVGEHFKTYADIKLYRVDIEIKSLSNWLSIYGFKPIYIDKNKLATIQINYDIPDKINFEINERFSGQINFFVKSGIGHFVPEMKITQTTTITFFSNDPAPIDDYLDLIFAFQSFLALAFFKYPVIESIKGENEFQLEKSRRTHELRFLFTKKYNDNKDVSDFLFRYSDIQEKTNEVLKKWFLLFKDIKPVVRGLIYSFDKSNNVSEFSFLNIVQCLEILHRRIRKNFLLDKAEFKAKINKIIAPIPAEYKKWTIDKLQYSNEPTLLHRLKEILQELPTDLKEKLFDDEQAFAESVKDTRNYYVHYSKQLERKALKGDEIFYVTEKLKVILVAFLLKELSILDERFTDEFIKRGRSVFYYTFKNFKSIVP